MARRFQIAARVAASAGSISSSCANSRRWMWCWFRISSVMSDVLTSPDDRYPTVRHGKPLPVTSTAAGPSWKWWHRIDAATNPQGDVMSAVESWPERIPVNGEVDFTMMYAAHDAFT